MKYTYTCSIDKHELSVNADNDQQAVERMSKEVMRHMQTQHPDTPMQSENEMMEMVRKEIKKKEPAVR